MWMLEILCGFLVFTTVHAQLCPIVFRSQFGECRKSCDGWGVEDTSYGLMGCLGLKCCIPDLQNHPSTSGILTAADTTMMPTTMGVGSVVPFDEQCGVQPLTPRTSRILSASKTKPCDWPWQVSIRSRIISGELGPKTTFPWCSGVLIDKEWVLTTAYCVILSLSTDTNRGKDDVLVTAGEYNTRDADYTGTEHNEQYLKVSNITIHPNYYKQDTSAISFDDISNPDNDKISSNFALLKLAEPVKFSTCVHKVCTPIMEDCWSKKECKIAGWGNVGLNTIGETSLELLEADVIIYSPAVCETIYDIHLNMTEQMKELTTCGRPKNPDVNVCLGDNGGMVVCQNEEGKWTLEGLVNRPKYDACNPGDMFEISYTQPAMEWVKSVTKMH